MIILESISGRIECGDQIFILSDSNVISASSKRQACRNDVFEIGGVYAASLSIVCRLPGIGLFDVKGAKIVLYSKYTSEEKPYCIGTFWVTSARRTKDIFTLDAMDAIGWLDTSSYNDTSSDGVKKMGVYLQNFEAQHVSADGNRPIFMEWFAHLTKLCNDFIQTQTGISNMLSWENYDDVNNIYFGNEHLWRNDGDGWHPKIMFRPSLYLDNGSADSDCPRDFFRYLAELTGGFICTNPQTGSLTLGQFGMVSPGKAEVLNSETAFDSLEIADYTILLHFIYVYGEIKTGHWASGRTKMTPDYDHHVYLHFDLEANPFLDGFAGTYVIDNYDSMSECSRGIWEAFYHVDAIANGVPGIEELREASKFDVRPFQCTVHAEKRFTLGQQIDFPNERKSSIITSIQWTFRGGHVLACGGSDARVMADCLRSSKGDKAAKEARNRCIALEKKVIS